MMKRLPRTADLGQFALQFGVHFGTVYHVRIIVAFIMQLAIVPLFAQEQESKLIDRLLRPNLSLTNPAQNRSFPTSSPSAFNRTPITAKIFHGDNHFRATSLGPDYLSSKEFAAGHFRTGESTNRLATNSQWNHPSSIEIPATALGNRIAASNNHAAASSNRVAALSSGGAPSPSYPNIRPFLGQGKSQKALHAYDRPLTIDQVRELLNKDN